MKYCYSTTINHSIDKLCPSVLENINTLLAREGLISSVPVFPKMEMVLNMDDAEALISSFGPRSTQKSMDLSFGISNADLSERQMVLVDIKLNVKPSLSSIVKEELTEKIVGSRTLLGNEIQIHGQYVFIFQDNLVELARRLFFRWNPRLDGENTAMSISQFRNTYFK
jgi:hypothetical protein